ncbi:MAG: DNA-binding protein [Coriobacteriia bacterium]|nr:DNA-binding protein [Coriobacteriia bacterium]
MGFISSYKKARAGEPGDEFVVQGTKVSCPHCGSTHFDKRNAQLNTAGLTFLGLDWTNTTASVLVCASCGRLEWFIKEPEQL